MLKAFVYMFKDKEFWKKYLPVFCFVVLANIFMNWAGIYAPILNEGVKNPLYYILYIIGFVIMFVPYGYSISALDYAFKCEENINLPFIDIKHNFLNGLKVILSGALLIVLLSVIFLILGFIRNALSGTAGEVLSSIVTALSFLILFFTSFMGIAMCCNYVKKPNYFNFINFKSAINIANENLGKYFIVYLITLLTAIVTYVLSMVVVSYMVLLGYLGIVLYSLFVSVIWTYIIYVYAYLFARSVKASSF